MTELWMSLRCEAERTHKGVCVYPDLSPCLSQDGIFSETSKHVDFSLTLTVLAHRPGEVNELVFDREGRRGGVLSFQSSDLLRWIS